MRIASLCSRRIVTVDAGSTLAQAAALMRRHHVGALVVTTRTSEGLGVNGIVTDRDLVIDVLARGLDVSGVRIGDLANKRLVSVTEDADMSQAISLMKESGVRRLLVTNAEQNLTGIVSFDDLMNACAGELDGLAQVVRSGIEREVAETTAEPTPPAPPLRIPAMGTVQWSHPISPAQRGPSSV